MHDKISELQDVTAELIFVPEKEHQKLKAQFWARFSASPFADMDNVTLSQVLEKVQDARLRKWWSVTGFKEWFTNRDEHRERLEYLFDLGMSRAESILMQDDPKSAGAQVNLIKLIGELTGRISGRGSKDEKFSEAKINNMSEADIQKFLEKKGVLIAPKKLPAEKFEG